MVSMAWLIQDMLNFFLKKQKVPSISKGYYAILTLAETTVQLYPVAFVAYRMQSNMAI